MANFNITKRIGRRYQAEVPDFIARNDANEISRIPSVPIVNNTNMERLWYSDESSCARMTANQVYKEEDRKLFEEAFNTFGKDFLKIQQKLPHKTTASLVEFYYLWKPSKSHLVENRPNKIDICRPKPSEPEIRPEHQKNQDVAVNSQTCSNCSSSRSKMTPTSEGNLCHLCFSYWNKHIAMRPVRRAKRNSKTF
ncbi:REST corepressor 1 [Chamberlinius hualienensis]